MVRFTYGLHQMKFVLAITKGIGLVCQCNRSQTLDRKQLDMVNPAEHLQKQNGGRYGADRFDNQVGEEAMRVYSRGLRYVFVLCVGVWLTGDLFGQTVATILGTVKDDTGAVLPGASITVKSLETGSVRTALTDETGTYRVPQLGLGTYELQAELPGFQIAVRSGIILTIGREANVDFVLKIGQVTESVTVSGDAPLVEVTNATLGALVDESTMRQLPLNGRNYLSLVALSSNANVLSPSSGQAR